MASRGVIYGPRSLVANCERLFSNRIITIVLTLEGTLRPRRTAVYRVRSCTQIYDTLAEYNYCTAPENLQGVDESGSCLFHVGILVRYGQYTDPFIYFAAHVFSMTIFCSHTLHKACYSTIRIRSIWNNIDTTMRGIKDVSWLGIHSGKSSRTS